MIHREYDIIKWAVARNILGPTGEGTKPGQQNKTQEECLELDAAITANDRSAVRDAIGDIIVTLVIQAQLWHLNIPECLDAAWNEIKDRKGKMINGVFVKE